MKKKNQFQGSLADAWTLGDFKRCLSTSDDDLLTVRNVRHPNNREKKAFYPSLIETNMLTG